MLPQQAPWAENLTELNAQQQQLETETERFSSIIGVTRQTGNKTKRTEKLQDRQTITRVGGCVVPSEPTVIGGMQVELVQSHHRDFRPMACEHRRLDNE